MTTKEIIKIQAETRELATKRANRELRLKGFVPGILYSKGSSEQIAVKVSSLPKAHTRAVPLILEVSGSAKTVLMREVQVNHVTDEPTHFDFQEVSSNDLVRASIPLVFVGLTKEQQKTGTLGPLVRSLDVTTVVSNLPESISVDVSTLTAGESVRLFDLDLPSTIKVRTGKGQNVALVSLIQISGSAAATAE